MRAVVLRSLAVIGVGAVLLVGVLYVASTVDARAPEVLGMRVTQPLGDDAERALITTSLEVAFNEPVDAPSAERAFQVEPAVDGSVSWSGGTMIFTPAEPLALDTAYTVRLTDGVVDLAGNEMTTLPPDFTFRTAGRPQVIGTDPPDGATDVPLDGAIGLTFSTLMDTVSVESALRIRPAFPHEIRWSGEVLEIVPAGALRPATEYEVRVGADAADIAGVTIGAPVEARFRTVAAGLRVEAVVPAAGIDGIAPGSPIAIVFDRPIDPDSVSSDMLSVSPNVAGALDVVTLAGEEPPEDGSGRVLRFSPSGPLPPNTTFDVELLPGLRSADGGVLADGRAWTFTTGTSVPTLSNQITFLTDRSGVANLWSMNPDGTGQRQLSAELDAVLDYAVAPDGSSFVVGDGRRLVFARADGTDRRVITPAGAVDFDPAYAPDSARLAFARADAVTGQPRGLWEWTVGGGDPDRLELPDADGGAGSPGEASPRRLRAPRYAPDGQALAFVDADGFVGILELPAARLTTAPFHAARPPAWLGDGSGILLSGEASGSDPAWSGDAPIEPLEGTGQVAVLRRSGTTVGDAGLGSAVAVAAVAADGRLGTIEADGGLAVASGLLAASRPVAGVDGPVTGVAFAPGEQGLLVVAIAPSGERGAGRLELVDPGGGEPTVLARGGWAPRWLP